MEAVGGKGWEEFQGYRILQAEFGGTPEIRGGHKMSKDGVLPRGEGQ